MILCSVAVMPLALQQWVSNINKRTSSPK